MCMYMVYFDISMTLRISIFEYNYVLNNLFSALQYTAMQPMVMDTLCVG